MRVFLVRHGETDWLRERRYQGHNPIPLNETGQQQVALLSARLAREDVQEVWSSDLPRTLETAMSIAKPFGLTPHLEPHLREMNLGAWEGFTFNQLRQRDPIALGRWLTDPLRCSPPGGESLVELAARVQQVLDELKGRWRENRTLILVSHGGPLRVLLCLFLGLPPEAHWRFELGPASLSRLDLYENGVTLSNLNDRHHLDALFQPFEEEEKQWEN